MNTESEIHVSASNLGEDEFDRNHSFSKTLDKIEDALDDQGIARCRHTAGERALRSAGDSD